MRKSELMMKKIPLVVIVGIAMLISGATNIVNAAENKIGFCNMDKAANESEEGKKAVSTLKDYMSSKQTAIQEKGREIDRMKSDLDKQGSAMSPDTKKSQVDELERSQREFQRMVSDAKEEFERKKRELTESVYKEIIEVIDKFGHDGKYGIILPVQSLLYADKYLDITDIIIKEYNAKKGLKPTAEK
jgi:outer membrane protein